jgi:hypothetical protein
VHVIVHVCIHICVLTCVTLRLKGAWKGHSQCLIRTICPFLCVALDNLF